MRVDSADWFRTSPGVTRAFRPAPAYPKTQSLPTDFMPRILIIDNEPQARKMMRLALMTSKHQVLEADHGRQGMSLLQSQPFDLVITEMLMPEVDGVEIIRTARILNPDARIIALSRPGRASPYLYLAIAEKVGAHKVLAKPFGETEFLEAVNELLQKPPSGSHCHGNCNK